MEAVLALEEFIVAQQYGNVDIVGLEKIREALWMLHAERSGKGRRGEVSVEQLRGVPPTVVHCLVLLPFDNVDASLCVELAYVDYLYDTLTPPLFVDRFTHYSHRRRLFHLLMLVREIFVSMPSDLLRCVTDQLVACWCDEEWRAYRIVIVTDNDYVFLEAQRPGMRALFRNQDVTVSLDEVMKRTVRHSSCCTLF